MSFVSVGDYFTEKSFSAFHYWFEALPTQESAPPFFEIGLGMTTGSKVCKKS